MPGSGATAFAHLVLGLTSLWAVVRLSHLPYATIGFALYFVNGVLGVLSYGVSESSLELYRVYRGVWQWSLSLGLPLFVSQVYVKAGFPDALALVHFVLPLGYLLADLRPGKQAPARLCLPEGIQLLYLCFLLYASLLHGVYYGVSAAVSYALAFYLVGTTGTVKNTPAKDLFNYALSFSIYFVVRTLDTDAYSSCDGGS